MSVGKGDQLRGESGFTLIELVIVMLISGLLIAPAFVLYYQHKRQGEIRQTSENIELMAAQISYFLAEKKRYPCPADPSLPETDPQYGREINADCDPTLLGVGPNMCAMGAGFCFVNGARDVGNDGTQEMVVIGAVPIVTLREAGFMVGTGTELDAWGSRLTYAVSQDQAAEGPPIKFRHGNGVIEALNEHDNATAGMNKNADFALVSHGRNRNGAHTNTGAVYESCGLLSNGKDNENCDNDSTFVQGLISDAPGGGRYDDYVYFGRSYNSSLWGYITGTQDIRNLNQGNVGVGLDDPDKLLDVAGTIGNNNNTRVDRICSKADPDACFSVDVITGSGHIECPTAGDVMVGIGDTNGPSPANCTTPVFTPLIPNQTCTGLNEWVIGFKSNGEIICAVP